MLHSEGNGQLKYKNGSKIEQRCVIEGNSPNFFISMKVASTCVFSYDPIFLSLLSFLLFDRVQQTT